MLIDGNLTGKVIGAAIEVHKQLGPGLLESTYEECLFFELKERGIEVERQVDIPIVYKGNRLESAYRIDLFVNGEVIVELKSCKKLEAIHEAQLQTYLKLANVRKGLLINFNVPVLNQGLKRILNN